jgi:vancomycin resistance protein YoaR
VPPITEVAGARARVGTILGAPLTLNLHLHEYEADGSVHLASRQWVVDQAVLSSWITLQPTPTDVGALVEVGIDREQVAAYLQKLAEEIDRPPREARFDYDLKTNTVKTITPGQNGYALDTSAAQNMLVDACLSASHQVNLPISTIPPRVTRANLEALRPLVLISEGESSFRGSTPERLQNIRVATARFHGLTIPAQTTFSFLENLGLVTIANGYSESWVIYGDRTVLGPGGGVCQVSTTCFRAAFWGGLPIVERSPHSYRVSWYEPPIGLDAAVFSPVVDVKFRNDTDTPILILTEIDEANAKLYFRFYGKRMGREVTMEGPTTSNPVKAGDPVYEEDPTLAPGARVQVESPHDGLDVTLYRVIKQNGAIVAKEKLFSRYDPWPARFRVGPARSEPTPAPPS